MGGNPVSFVDPDGQWAWLISAGVNYLWGALENRLENGQSWGDSFINSSFVVGGSFTIGNYETAEFNPVYELDNTDTYFHYENGLDASGVNMTAQGGFNIYDQTVINGLTSSIFGYNNYDIWNQDYLAGSVLNPLYWNANELSPEIVYSNGGMAAGIYRGNDGLPQDIGPDFYYDALNGVRLPNGTKLSRGNLHLTFDELASSRNAEYRGRMNGKFHINFDIKGYEITVGNIRATGVHEAYGHGVMGWDTPKDHYKAYWAVIDGPYFANTTKAWRQDAAYGMWSWWTKSGRYGRMPEKYMWVVDKYY